VSEAEDFLKSVLPRLTEADTAFHNGDARPRIAIWSRKDPVTLFGALLTKGGWQEVGPAFEWLASRFSNCESFEYEVIAAGASGDLAYLVGIERTKASVGGAAPEAYALRVTTIFRRENGEWKAVHRHGDPLPDSVAARSQLARLREGESKPPSLP
jgi:ketosteroid isomerase-like protein